MTVPGPGSPIKPTRAQKLAQTVHRDQANGFLRCANCGGLVGHPHDVLCYAYANARGHLRHMTDGAWHDSCTFCRRRRVHGGTGLEPDPKCGP
jgi:hypothetical protein